jgi:hypothetical protein
MMAMDKKKNDTSWRIQSTKSRCVNMAVTYMIFILIIINAMKPENLCLKIKNILFFQGPQYFLWRFQARIIPKNDPIDSTPQRLA